MVNNVACHYIPCHFYSNPEMKIEMIARGQT